MAKLFEGLLKRRLVSFLEENRLLPDSQYAFRKGLNTQMCLVDLLTSINLSWYKKLIHFALLVDIKGAFDNVQHQDLLDELLLI